MDWQAAVALGIVGICAVYLAFRFRSYLRRTEAGGCGCGDCPTGGVLEKLRKQHERTRRREGRGP